MTLSVLGYGHLALGRRFTPSQVTPLPPCALEGARVVDVTALLAAEEIDPVTILVEKGDVCSIVGSDGDTVITRSDQAPQTIVSDGDTVTSVANEATDIVADCKVGPPGKDGADGSGGGVQVNTAVATTATVTADSLLIANVKSVRWTITLNDNVNGLSRMSEVLSVHNGSATNYTHFGIIGDAISCNISTVITGGTTMDLLIENTHTEDLSVSVLRMEIGV